MSKCNCITKKPLYNSQKGIADHFLKRETKSCNVTVLICKITPVISSENNAIFLAIQCA